MPDYITPAQPWNTGSALPQPSQSPMAGVSTYDDYFARKRNEQIRQNIAMAQTPDQVAQATKMARQIGTLPSDVEGVVSEAEKALRANNFSKLLEAHPAIGDWAAGDPRGAVAASDDTKSLGFVGSAVDMFKKIPGRVLGAGMLEGAAGLREAADAFTLPADYVNYGFDAIATTILQQAGLRKGYDPGRAFDEKQARQAAGRQQLRDEADRIRQANTGSNFYTDSVLAGLESIPLTVAAALTRNPTLAVAVPAVSVGGNAYAKAEEKGLSGMSALRYAVAQGGTEYLTEKIPASKLVEALAKRTPFARALIAQLGEEIPNEQIATAVQDLADWAYLNPEKPFSDYLNDRPDAALSTLIGTVAGTSVQTGAATAMDRAVRAVGSLAGRGGAAVNAMQDASVLDALARSADGSKLRTRDPEAYAALIKNLADNDHLPSQVFVPAEAIVAYQQSDSYDQFDDPFADYQGQINEALATGGDVVLPAEFALARLPGTTAWDAVRDDLRLRPGGMSMREAQEFQQNLDAHIKEASDRAASSDQADAAERDQRIAMVEARTQELQNAGFSPRIAGIYAELDVLRAAVRAQRNGRPLDPQDFGSAIRAVLPPSLAEIRRADDLDVVIHAMRKRAPASRQGGKSLLEWIAARGGVQDRGGDIAAMGGDRWHLREPQAGAKDKKGRPARPTPIKGRSRLLAPFNEAQGNMIGGGGERALSIGNTLDAAISEGYFPDLLAARENGEKIDDRVLLDAISDELGGAPRYAEEAQVDQTRAAAEDLRAMLEETGRDPDGMTDAEVRTAIREFTTASGQEGFDQASEPVATVRGDEIAPETYHGPELRKAVVAWYKSHLQGQSVLSQALGHDVVFASSGKMKSSSADEQKLRAVSALRTIIERGDLISSQEPYDRTREPSIKAYHRLRAVIMIEGQAKAVDVTIREANNGTFYYDHVLPENNAARNPESPEDKPGTGEPGGYEQSSDSSDNFNMSILGQDKGPRGRFIPGRDGARGTIELFQSRNLSTLIHEFGHQWLEELRADATHPEASDQIKADWETVKAWFSALGHPLADDGTIPVEAHEYWARGVERYLMEGKAPSSGLARLFETVRGWMLNIYRKVEALRAPISPEIREVFGRMLATDEEIEAKREALALQPAITDPAALGMTGPEFEAYSALAQGARDKASADLLAKTMAAIRRQRTKAWNDERATVRAAEAERLDDAPLLKSLRLMKESPISREWLVDRMGQDVLDLLPRQVPPIYKTGGVNPDELAELAGFESGRHMVEVLMGAQRQHLTAKEGGDERGMRARMIDNAADEEMARRHGDDPLSDGSIEEEAIATVNNDLAGDLLSTELRYLGRRSGQQATPWRAAKAWARDKVRGGVIAQEASPSAIQRHTRAVAKAGREAEKAMTGGKMEEAFAAKQRQMLSTALLSEAKAAYDEVTAAQARLAKIAKRKTMKSVDQAYLEQAHALLDAVQLGPRSEKSIERQGKWAAWAAQQEADGREVIVPHEFEATIRGTPWSRLTVENALGLDEAVGQVMHFGRLKQTLLDNKEEREWNDIFQEAERSAQAIDGPPPHDLTDPTLWESIKGKALALDASLLKLETVFDWLDGGDPNGVFNRIAFRPIAEAQDRENAMLADYYGRVKALFEAIPAEDGARWRDKLEMPWVDPHTGRPMRLERSKVIAMALNIGNEGNLQRLSDGYRVPASVIEWNLTSTLTAGEWKFVQSVWDTIDTLWPQIEGLEKRVNGVAPEKIAPRAFDTPHGPMRGGYYPAIYDTSRDYRAEERGGKESDLLGANYTRATTRARATKERAEKVTAPILLDLGVINRHLGEVIHDITHREAVIQANRFLTSERVSRAVDAALGPDIRKQFRPWVKFVANSWAMERAGNEGAGKWLGKLRANVTVVGMGLRATTMVSQIAGYANSVEVVGEAAMAKALTRFAASPVETTQFVLERSGEVRARMDTLDRDVRNQIAAMATVNPVGKLARQALDAKRFMFHGVGYMDRIVSVPTWMAAYSNAISAGMAEQDAVYSADKAVRQSQGAGSPKDMAAVVRGTGRWGEATKLFTMFYSYFSAQYQRQRSLARDMAGRDERQTRNLPKLASRAFFLLVVPPLLTELIKAGVTGGGGPDDDEWWAQWLARKLLANALGPIPLVRDVFEPTWNAVRGGKVLGSSLTPMQRAADSLVQAGRDVGHLARGDETKHATKDILETAGYATGLIPGQIASATQFLVDLGDGDADPQSVGDWIEGLTTGKVKKDGE